jgi:Tfp pilus assembly protein PilX
VILLIALIVLVAMTLATIAMVRSVDTTNVVAGNLAFKQAASQTGDAGVEAAIKWLEAQSTANISNLYSNNLLNGYSAQSPGMDPGANQSWDAFWTASIDPNPPSTPVAAFTCSTTGVACYLPTDAAGNTVAYSITRLCFNQNSPNSIGNPCPLSPAVASATSNSSQGAGVVDLQYTAQVYYRITTRTVGPRNSVSYLQTIIAM